MPVKQLSLFGVEAAPPAPVDLEGLLAGPGQVVRMGGTARVSVTVDELWRARALRGELAVRGIPATLVATGERAADAAPAGDAAADRRICVRSAYASTLAPLAVAWLREPEAGESGQGELRQGEPGVGELRQGEPGEDESRAGELRQDESGAGESGQGEPRLRGAVKLPPPGFGLDGRRLRLWVIAAGYGDELGFSLRLGVSDEPAWERVGLALAAVGLPAVLLTARAGGPAYRIAGRRRVGRLAELVGDRPGEAPAGAWPAW